MSYKMGQYRATIKYLTCVPIACFGKQGPQQRQGDTGPKKPPGETQRSCDNVHGRQYDLHEEEEEGKAGCKEGDGQGECKLMYHLYPTYPQAILDAMEKEREEQELAEALEKENEPVVEFYNVCNNGGKPKRRTYTTD